MADEATRLEATVHARRMIQEHRPPRQIISDLRAIYQLSEQEASEAYRRALRPVREESYFYVNILSPQNGALFDLETDITSEAVRNRQFHKTIMFRFEITGGNPGFRYEVKVRRRGPNVPHEYNDHFWPYRREGGRYVPVPLNERRFNDNLIGEERFASFFKGGSPEQEFHPFREDDNPNEAMRDPNGSLPEGIYEIIVTVRDNNGAGRTTTATSMFQIVSKPRSRLVAHITQPPPLTKEESDALEKEGKRAVRSYRLNDSTATKREYTYRSDEDYAEAEEHETKNRFHDPIEFNCEVDGGSGRYHYEWFIQDVRHAGEPSPTEAEAAVKLPLRFVGMKNFSIGGPLHPVEPIPEGNHERVDPHASLPEGLYRVIVRVTDMRGLQISGQRGPNTEIRQNTTAEATIWMRIGEEQGPTTRSLASYLGMRPRAAPIGGGILPGAAHGTMIRRHGVSGAANEGGVFRRMGSEIGERAMYRMQHPTAGSGRFARVLKNETMEGTGTWGSESERGKIYTNPAVQAAINQGKRELNRWARQLFRPEFERTRRELGRLTTNWTRRRDAWITARNRVYTQFGRGRISRMWAHMRGQGGADALTNIIAQEQQASRINETQARLLTDEVNQAYNLFTKAEEDLMNFSSQRAKEMQDRINTRMAELAKDITGRVVYRFKLNRISGAENFVKSELDIEAAKVAENMIAHGKDTLSGAVGTLRSASMRMKTFGSAYFGLKDYLWQIISAPWMWGFAFAMVQFYFILTYVGFNPTYLWVMPAITAGFTFLVNFADTTRPFDWFNHLASGAIIGYSALLFMVALGFGKFSFIIDSPMWFWVIWGIFSFIGIFQFYHTGGFRIALQGGIIILLFAYIALGPYSGYYNQVIDNIRGPVEIAWHAAYKTVNDVYLLATNPTEWYARQQVQNVRPEKALGTAKGVEINAFDSLPQSVPSGQQFAITTVLKHEGVLDNATDIKVSFSCNQWCSTDGVEPADKATVQGGAGVEKIGNTYFIRNAMIKDAAKIDMPASRLLKGESLVASFSGFRANSVKGRENEYRLAKVTMNVSYAYSTTSSLFVEVINTPEFNRRTNEGKGFRNVVATGKNTPAQLSLNVGPQPLLAGKNALLLVAVSNARDKSSVVLHEGDEIIIRMPRAVGNGLRCDGFEHDGRIDGNPDQTQVEVVRYKIIPRGVQTKIEIRSADFNTIFPFICSFTANSLQVLDRDVGEPSVQTGLITAEIPRYEFITTHEKDVPVTVPLGIIFDPYDATCRQCGTGNDCSAAECHSFSGSGGRCYYDYSKEIPATPFIDPNVPLANVCKSCGPEPACEQFAGETTCSSEGGECGLDCAWNPNFVNDIGVKTGVCYSRSGGGLSGNLKDVKLSGNTIRKIIQASKAAGFSKEDTKRVLAIAAQESGYTMVQGDGGDSVGIFQLNRPAHPEWFNQQTSGCPAGQSPYDEDCNIKLGVNHIRNLYDSRYNDPPKRYACRSTEYSGWDAVFRWYNGWNTDCSKGTLDYVAEANRWVTCTNDGRCVENAIISEYTNDIKELVGENMLEAVFIGKGGSNFCQDARVNTPTRSNSGRIVTGYCSQGEGGCTQDNQCLTNMAVEYYQDLPAATMTCLKDPEFIQQLSGKSNDGSGVCCFDFRNQLSWPAGNYPGDEESKAITYQRCKTAFDSWADLRQAAGTSAGTIQNAVPGWSISGGEKGQPKAYDVGGDRIMAAITEIDGGEFTLTLRKYVNGKWEDLDCSTVPFDTDVSLVEDERAFCQSPGFIRGATPFDDYTIWLADVDMQNKNIVLYVGANPLEGEAFPLQKWSVNGGPAGEYKEGFIVGNDELRVALTSLKGDKYEFIVEKKAGGSWERIDCSTQPLVSRVFLEVGEQDSCQSAGFWRNAFAVDDFSMRLVSADSQSKNAVVEISDRGVFS